MIVSETNPEWITLIVICPDPKVDDEPEWLKPPESLLSIKWVPFLGLSKNGDTPQKHYFYRGHVGYGIGVIWGHMGFLNSMASMVSSFNTGGVGEAHRRPVSQVPRSPSGGAGLQSHGPLGGDAERDPTRCGDDQQEVAMGQVRSWKWRCLVDLGPQNWIWMWGNQWKLYEVIVWS